jgi:arginyl-tRNA synthetase
VKFPSTRGKIAVKAPSHEGAFLFAGTWYSFYTYMIQKVLERNIAQALRNIGIEVPDHKVGFTVEHPEDLSHGDYATNAALVYAKNAGVSPRDLAVKISAQLTEISHISKTDIAGPGFINFHLNPKFFIDAVASILAEKDSFGSNVSGKDKQVLVEYSSPNIAKPFTVGHLRSTVIGDAVANILAFSGYKVIRDNHLGDWGTQFGKQIVALRRWGDSTKIDSIQNENGNEKMKYLVDLYVKFHDEADKEKESGQASLEDEARAAFAALEKGDLEATALYEKILAVSMEYFAGIYKRLNVSPFDTQHGEHFYEAYIPKVMHDLEKANILSESEGAKLVFFPKIGEGETAKEKYPPFMIQKKDGATLYATRDLATDKWRKEAYGPHITIINEVGIEQSLHFRQLFEVEEMLGYFKKGERIHIPHGFYRFEDGKMSTRKGNVIWLEDIINEAVKRAGDINPETADIVGIGAIKFNDLKRESSQDIIFSWDEMLNLKGDSCTYLQYSYARAMSIVEKAGVAGIDPHVQSAEDALVSGQSRNLSSLEKIMYRFPEVVLRAGVEHQPHYIATYLVELAGTFNTFYGNTVIIDKKNELSSYYVALTLAFATIIKNGLGVLGIAVPEKM